MTGWGFTHRPAPTVTGHGIATRQASGQQDVYRAAIAVGRFIFRPPFDAASARRSDDPISLSRAFHGDAINPSVEEAALLQSYPTSWPPVGAPDSGITALDDFAGTGWGVACAWLGIRERGVELMDEAVATREYNGLVTVGRDVWDHLEYQLEHPWAYDLYISSPPCQTFSMAGKGTGRRALDEVLQLIEERAYQRVEDLRAFGERHDPRTALVLVPLVRVWRDLPRYVVLEQVPTVLPVWERMAEEMRRWGYSVWTGKLYAEQYGVPQTRTRAILIAKRDPELDGEALPPVPTHSRYYSRSPERLDPGVEKWVSMAEALDWGMTARPYPSIAPGTGSGGTDPLALGGSGARRTVDNEAIAGRWAAKRPATTVVADPRLGGPGRSEYVKGGVSRQNREGSISLELEEAQALQSYPKAFTFLGNKGKRFLQVGNAVPPVLGRAILEAVVAEQSPRP